MSKGFLWCLLLLATVPDVLEVVAQTGSNEQCQAVLDVLVHNPMCAAVGNCTGLQCEQSNGLLDGSSVAFVVNKCKDPVTVDLVIQSRDVTLNLRGYTQSDTIFLGGSLSNVLLIKMQRNASDLQFQVQTNSGDVVIPQVYVPLNASDCMCQSLSRIAGQIHHNDVTVTCSTNEQCSENLIHCSGRDIRGIDYEVNVTVLPCENAFQIEGVRIGNNARQNLPFKFTESFALNLSIINFNALIEATIIPHNYSLEVQINITDFMARLMREEVVPHGFIILDKSTCSFAPSLPPLPTPSTPIRPPANAIQSCHDFFKIINKATSKPFLCVPMEKCEVGIRCRLDILDTYYHINVSLITTNIVFTVDGPMGMLISSGEGHDKSVSLPEPKYGILYFKASKQLHYITIKLDLSVPDLNQETMLMTPLISLTTINLQGACATSSAISILIVVLALSAILLQESEI